MRFAVVGTNFISKEFVRALRSIPNATVQCVCSRQTERAQAFSEENGIPAALCLTDLDALAARTDVDAVYIASPNRFHAPQAETMLRAGKHVLLEKPACPDRETFAGLCAVADEQGVTLIEGTRSVFTPGFAALRAAAATVGTVRRASFSYCQYSSRYDKYKQGVVENAFDPSLCNGALMDIGVYCVHALVSLFGSPERVLAVSQKLGNGLDAQGGALCAYDGMLTEVAYSKIADGRRQSEIQGEEGTVLADNVTNPKRIVRVARSGKQEVLYEDADGEFFGMAHEIRAFLQFAAGEERERYLRHRDDTLAALALMDEIRRQTDVDFVCRGNTEGGERA